MSTPFSGLDFLRWRGRLYKVADVVPFGHDLLQITTTAKLEGKIGDDDLSLYSLLLMH
jgi:hypothetical protein